MTADHDHDPDAASAPVPAPNPGVLREQSNAIVYAARCLGAVVRDLFVLRGRYAETRLVPDHPGVLDVPLRALLASTVVLWMLEAAIAFAGGGESGGKVTALISALFGLVLLTAVLHLGARVVMWGDDFDDASRGARAYAQVSGAHLVNPGDTPALVHGNASMGLELANQLASMGVTDVAAVIAPVGVGSCAAALGLGLHTAGWPWPLVGAQSDRAPAMHDAWRRGQRTPRAVGTTVADGLAVGEPPRYTSGLLRQMLDEFQLVDEGSIVAAMEAFRLAWGAPEPEDLRRVGLAQLHGVVEGAGAVALACARDLVRARPELRRLVVVASGANVDPTLG